MIDIGFLANLNLPLTPIYLLLHPADHSLTKYSTPKKTTKNISYNIAKVLAP